MARKQRPEKREDRSKRAVRAVLSLLPLLAAFGVLAPGIVRVLAQADPEDEEEVAFDFPEGVRLGRQPLLPVPRDFSAGFVPELLDLENLFSRNHYDGSDERVQQLFARLLSFPRNHGDAIVLDDVDRRLSQIVFADPVMVGQLAANDDPPPNPGTFPLGDPVPNSDGVRYDDPIQPLVLEDPTVVPEPGSGALLGAALVGVAWRRRAIR